MFWYFCIFYSSDIVTFNMVAGMLLYQHCLWPVLPGLPLMQELELIPHNVCYHAAPRDHHSLHHAEPWVTELTSESSVLWDPGWKWHIRFWGLWSAGSWQNQDWLLGCCWLHGCVSPLLCNDTFLHLHVIDHDRRQEFQRSSCWNPEWVS